MCKKIVYKFKFFLTYILFFYNIQINYLREASVLWPPIFHKKLYLSIMSKPARCFLLFKFSFLTRHRLIVYGQLLARDPGFCPGVAVKIHPIIDLTAENDAKVYNGICRGPNNHGNHSRPSVSSKRQDPSKRYPSGT